MKIKLLILITMLAIANACKHKYEKSVMISITNHLSKDDLFRIKNEQLLNKINISYNKIVIDSIGILKSLDVKVSYNDLENYSHIDLSDSSKIGFIIVDTLNNKIKIGSLSK